MENRARWIAVRVDMLDHEILQGEPYSRRDAWLWLIANAAWKDHQVRTRGGVVTLRRGEVLAGLEHLAKTWGWSIKKVRTFLRDLNAAGMIAKGQARTQYATAYSLTKYETYQTAGPADDRSAAGERQTKGKREAREGQDSTRDTKDTNYPLPSDGRMSARKILVAGDGSFDRMWEAYPRKVAKADARKAWQKLSSEDREAAIAALPAFCATIRGAKTEERYIPYPASWLNGRRFEDLSVASSPAMASGTAANIKAIVGGYLS